MGDRHVLQLQKGANPWALKHSEMEKHGGNWKEVGRRGWCGPLASHGAQVCAKKEEVVCAPKYHPLEQQSPSHGCRETIRD